jgi:hypothetical protein
VERSDLASYDVDAGTLRMADAALAVLDRLASS